MASQPEAPRWMRLHPNPPQFFVGIPAIEQLIYERFKNNPAIAVHCAKGI
ncbi:MAG: hypothetical protein JO273_00140 [Methylobacteriaceae bacterium]|nr:hypothetical protein [Methylobacteriaceae bacterium]